MKKFESFEKFLAWTDTLKDSPYGRIKERGGGRGDGDWYEAEFELESGATVYWNNESGWEDKAEHDERARKEKIRYWDEEWNGLSETKREFILLIIPDILERDKSKTKSPSNCLHVAMRDAVRKGLVDVETCSRCGGGGHYSWNQMHGSVCYGCGGKGKAYPRVTKKLIKEIILRRN